MYLVSNIEYPASQYEPLEPEINGVYHEDREVNASGDVGASQMYSTYNAQFFPDVPEWKVVTADCLRSIRDGSEPRRVDPLLFKL